MKHILCLRMSVHIFTSNVRLFLDTWVHNDYVLLTLYCQSKKSEPLSRAHGNRAHKLIAVIRVLYYASIICFQHSIILYH